MRLLSMNPVSRTARIPTPKHPFLDPIQTPDRARPETQADVTPPNIPYPAVHRAIPVPASHRTATAHRTPTSNLQSYIFVEPTPRVAFSFATVIDGKAGRVGKVAVDAMFQFGEW
jgi:hypothetical protein